MSDYVGRRPVILVSLLINLGSLVIFLFAASAWDLIGARVVQGLTVGVGTTAFGATILDTDKPHAPTINSLTNFVGLAAGVFVSGLLVSYAPYPTKLIFVLLVAINLIELAMLIWMPETTQKRSGAMRSMIPRVIIPPQVRAPFGRISPINIAAWALGGFYLSLMPPLVVQATGIQSPMIGAIAVTCLMIAAGITVIALSRWYARRELICSSVTLVVGVAITLGGVHSVPALFVGSIIGGIGFGAAFSGGLRSILPLAAADDRAGVLATYFVESYLAFSVPAIIAGVLTPRLGLTTSAYAYGAVLAVLAFASLVAIIVAKPAATTAS
ncbi:MAG TPA: MFS transporter [Pirellulales bacterium]|nr:MFS transporter [Pirellulales bacterium]